MLQDHRKKSDYHQPIYVVIEALAPPPAAVVSGACVTSQHWEPLLMCKECNFQTRAATRMSAHMLSKHVHKVSAKLCCSCIPVFV